MSCTIIALRGEPGLSATIEAGRKFGLAIAGCALFEAQPLSWEVPERGEGEQQFDALLIGSANVFRMGGPQLDALRDLPVLAVGEATARAAKEAGFAVKSVGKEGLQALVDSLGGQKLHLLRLAGEAHIPLVHPPGIEITQRIIYRMQPLQLTHKTIDMLRGSSLVLLHSAEAAKRFAKECDSHRIDRRNIAIAALSARIAEAAGEGWAKVRHCQEPREGALLALAASMCH